MKISAKFRLPSHNKETFIDKQLTYDLDLFMHKVSASFNKPFEYFNQCKCLVINKFQSELQNNSSSIVSCDKFLCFLLFEESISINLRVSCVFDEIIKFLFIK